ncbi:uncharacterized protein PHACADRAFT_203372 [Phanerochaete carnosa HHB-10118-sp]|uniref:Uncharacterized protein n=2 Tax=Phanerochaete carnosa (strain HHB-10118-sp) TaxID=650164 RepID=K5VN36_PHACS|nr:uncharacterized protein PHACADRAFT_203372 [Phanerochaete carnosa HHB-10118-sp]EKM48009.1 hypothetical protein PHACADRAFT_203372 [Phanerochaete carnosa HHB-10118-sp]
MLLKHTRATSPVLPATTSRLAELDTSIAWLDHWLETTNGPASDAPPGLRGVAQRDRVDMSDLHAEKEEERDLLDAELFDSTSDHDGYATESDVERNGQSSDDESGYDGDDDSDDAHGQLLLVRRLVSPPLEHSEYRVVSPPPIFLQNRALARSSPGQLSRVPEYSGQAPGDDDVRQAARTVVSTAPHPRYNVPSGRADHVVALFTTSGYRDASEKENQRGKKRALEVEEVKEEVDEKPRKRHAANKENVAARPRKHDDDDHDLESCRPQRSAVRPSFCHPSRYVKNRDRLRTAGAANAPTAAPATPVALPTPIPAAPVAAPIPATAAPAAQPAQGAFIIIPPPPAAPAPPAPTYLPSIVQVLADLPNQPYNIVLPPIVAHQPPVIANQPATMQNLRMQLGFIIM